jgi:hypothetical protein
MRRSPQRDGLGRGAIAEPGGADRAGWGGALPSGPSAAPRRRLKEQDRVLP